MFVSFARSTFLRNPDVTGVVVHIRDFKMQRRDGNENVALRSSFFIAIIPTHLLCQM